MRGDIMKKFYNLMEEKVKKALNNIGYNVDTVTINESNRPDLGQYQYNGVMQLAKV